MRVSDKVRAGPCGSGRARVVEFSLNALQRMRYERALSSPRRRSVIEPVSLNQLASGLSLSAATVSPASKQASERYLQDAVTAQHNATQTAGSVTAGV